MKDSQLSKKKPRKFKNISSRFIKGSSRQYATPKKVFKSADSETPSFFAKAFGAFKKINISAFFSFKKNKFSFSSVVKNIYRNDLDLFLAFIPLSLLIYLLIVNHLNLDLERKINKSKLRPLNFSVKLSPYPLMNKLKEPEISAESAIVTEVDSQVVLYSKNPDLKFSLASTTKIMSALVGLDYYQENSVLSIYSPVIEGSNIGFYYGEKFTFKDLLYAMFLPSSNEAAYALAENYPGGKDAFVSAMNRKAQDLGLLNTHFQDPVGLDDDNDYTTASDLSHLAEVAIKNKLLSSIFSTKETTIYNTTRTRVYKIKNLNKLLGIDGVNGIKTGTTEGAGEVLVVSKMEKGHAFIIIVMKSKQRFADTLSLMSMISNNIDFIIPQLPPSLVSE